MLEDDCRRFDVDCFALSDYLACYAESPDLRSESGTAAAITRAKRTGSAHWRSHSPESLLHHRRRQHCPDGFGYRDGPPGGPVDVDVHLMPHRGNGCGVDVRREDRQPVGDAAGTQPGHRQAYDKRVG
ncbi:hypothetical protein MINTM021_10010 [Mycobacterium paraintracellulare]|nr:hypothetical protein MINTM021_10010 [Mycobacterium paraintracellulare]